MSSIIEELFYGNIKPSVKHFDPDSPYGQATRLKDKNFDKLMAARWMMMRANQLNKI